MKDKTLLIIFGLWAASMLVIVGDILYDAYSDYTINSARVEVGSCFVDKYENRESWEKPKTIESIYVVEDHGKLSYKVASLYFHKGRLSANEYKVKYDYQYLYDEVVSPAKCMEYIKLALKESEL